MKCSHLHSILAVSTIALSLVSFVVVMQGGGDEPYVVFRRSDAIVQVGVAMMLMLLWVQLAAGMIYGIVRQRLSMRWLPLLFWILICEFFLNQGVIGYVQDITRYVAGSQ